jgi:hypothetical protein
MKKMLLGELAQIETGYPFRSRISGSGEGNVSLIQLRNLTEADQLDISFLMRVEIPELDDKFQVELGDLIFRSRGTRFTTVLIEEKLAQTIIAAPLFRIRILDKIVLSPIYLNWYFKQKPVQDFLTSHARGSVMKLINKKTLNKLEIAIPSVETQQQLVELLTLSQQEEMIARKLMERRSLFLNEVMKRLAEGEMI